MPNKKLKDKLLAKRSIIVQLKTTQKSTSAFALGALAFKALDVSTSHANLKKHGKRHGLPCYGKYINPFPEFDGKIRNLSHSEFRRGFNLTRRPKPIVIETVAEV